MKRMFNSFIDLFFPRLCAVCNGKLAETETHICIDCIASLPRTNQHLHPDNRLAEAFAGRIPYERIAAYAYFVKEGSLQSIIHEMKYRNNKGMAEYMGELCGKELKGSEFISGIDCLVPVPLHAKRIRERGYNQSLEICRGMASQIGVDIDATSLVRVVNNPSQAASRRFDRWQNVADVFALADGGVFAGRHVLLVDDVITTGSTIEACVNEILKCEGARVSIYCIGMAT